MTPSNAVIRIVALASLVVAMMLRILPWSGEWRFYNPDWVLLCLIYWAMAAPEVIGVVFAWSAGLFVDALTGRMLGQHALAYAVVAYFCVKWSRWLRLFPAYQQTLAILPLLMLSQLLVFWTQRNQISAFEGMIYWLPSVAGALVWPLVFFLLRRLRRRSHVF